MRDIIHIDDLCSIICNQIKSITKINNEIFNIGGGPNNAISLKELSAKCQKITQNKVKIKKIKRSSNYDIPYFVTDNKKIQHFYKWKPKKNIDQILNDIFVWLSANQKIEKIYF